MQLERLNFIGRMRRDELDAKVDASKVQTDFDHSGARNRFRKRYVRLAKDAYLDGEISKAKLIEALSLVMEIEKAEAMAASSSRWKERR